MRTNSDGQLEFEFDELVPKTRKIETGQDTGFDFMNLFSTNIDEEYQYSQNSMAIHGDCISLWLLLIPEMWFWIHSPDLLQHRQLLLA